MTGSDPTTQAEGKQRANAAENGHLRSTGDALRALYGGYVDPPRQTITAADTIEDGVQFVDITGPSSSTYAVTLNAPKRPGQPLVIKMSSTTATNAVTLALTNVVGGSAATTATFNAADETLVLLSTDAEWVVLAEVGVTLA